ECANADEKVGVDIIRRSIEAPLRVIASNAGFEGSVIVEKVKNLPKGEGLNCETGEFGNLLEMGVIDPVKVIRTSLQNAASIAVMILITEATINDIKSDAPDPAAMAAAMQGAGGMGMM
ncbi:MAG: chaperonin GroEL, partial [bacterium]|nr:chaperonin GroEL [bacterium]